MRIIRTFSAGFLSIAVSVAALGLGGCGDSAPATGTVAKVDPAEVQKNQDTIRAAYKSDPSQQQQKKQPPPAPAPTSTEKKP